MPSDDDWDDRPLWLGLGACHTLSERRNRVNRKQPIGFRPPAQEARSKKKIARPTTKKQKPDKGPRRKKLPS